MTLAHEGGVPQMIDRTFFTELPWDARDPRAILVKIAWHQLTGGARETHSLKPWSRRLARKGLVDRIRLDDGGIRLTVTPAGRDYLLVSMLEKTLGRPLTGNAVQWIEAPYVKRLLTAADEPDDG